MVPRRLQYVERPVFMKEVNTQKFWTSELRSQECVNVRIWSFVGFQQRDGQDSQTLNNDTFCRPPVTIAQYLISTEKNPDAGMLLNYDDNDYTQGYGQFKEASRAFTKDDILQPYISDNYSRYSNDGDDKLLKCLN